MSMMGPRESKDEREQRIARLWETLDSHKEGQIDLTGLRKGLKNLDHREPTLMPLRDLPACSICVSADMTLQPSKMQIRCCEAY
jgi:hypothetical protein